MLLEFSKPLSRLGQPSPTPALLTTTTPGLRCVSPIGVQGTSIFHSLPTAKPYSGKDETQASDLRLKDRGRSHDAEGQPSPGKRGQMGDTPESQEVGAGNHRDVCPRQNATLGKE